MEKLVSEGLPSPVQGVILYGSAARETTIDSIGDTDLLAVTAQPGGKVYLGNVSIASYTEDELRQVFEDGTLFGTHLKLESRILDDPSGKVHEAYDSYREPDLLSIRREMWRARELLGVSEEDFNDNPYNCLALVRHICRTLAIIEYRARNDSYEFSVPKLAEALDLPALLEIVFHEEPTSTDWHRFIGMRALSSVLVLGTDIPVAPINLTRFARTRNGINPRLANLADLLVAPSRISMLKLFSTRLYNVYPYVSA